MMKSEAILDTTVVLHLYRKYQPAIDWFNSDNFYAITSITWMEVVQGATSKANLRDTKAIMAELEILHLTAHDQQWAMRQLERFQFSHHIGMADCLIASVAQRLKLPLYTHNTKDMTPLIGDLAIKAYD